MRSFFGSPRRVRSSGDVGIRSRVFVDRVRFSGDRQILPKWRSSESSRSIGEASPEVVHDGPTSFARRKHDFTIEVGTLASKVTQIHYSPCDDRIHGQAVQRSRQFLNRRRSTLQPDFNVLKKIQFATSHSTTERQNDFLNLFQRVDWQSCHQQPPDRFAASWWVPYFAPDRLAREDGPHNL